MCTCSGLWCAEFFSEAMHTNIEVRAIATEGESTCLDYVVRGLTVLSKQLAMFAHGGVRSIRNGIPRWLSSRGELSVFLGL